LESGFREATSDLGLDVVVINTCTVTASADSRSRALIRRFHRLNPQASILVTGCYAEKNKDELARMEGVHLVVSQNEKESLVERFLEELPITDGVTEVKTYQDLPISRFSKHTRAFLKIQDGCDRNCSYCKVKVVRGFSRSRPLESVLSEAKRLVEAGHREIVLAGIQLGAYGDDFSPQVPLDAAMEKILAIPGLLRLRLSSIEPGDVTDGVINLMATHPRVAHQMHIPLQSGNNDVLKRMKRGYTREFYLDLIQKIQDRVPDFCLGMDAMAGFCGETDEAFEETLDVVRQTRALKVHMFPYSPREGTVAAHFSDNIPPNIQKRRMAQFARVAAEVSASRKMDFIGKDLKVLVEEKDGLTGAYRGHTTHQLPVRFQSNGDLSNQEVIVRLKTLDGDFLEGELVETLNVQDKNGAGDLTQAMVESH